MASNPDFVQYISDQCSGAGEIEAKKMFGDYGIYCNGKIFGLICDNGFYLKPTEAGRKLLRGEDMRPPYDGAKSYFYIEDVVCDNSNPEVVEPRLINKCLQHKIQMSRFESNSAGGRVAQSVQAEVKARGGITKITTKYTTQNKETKIIMASPFVKEHFLFKDSSVIKEDKEYRRFMNFMCSYTMAGKNKWDDVADACAMLSDFVQSFSRSQVEVIQRPW